MTSAPQSASWRTAVGPARARQRSITFKPDNGMMILLGSGLKIDTGSMFTDLLAGRQSAISGWYLPLSDAPSNSERRLREHSFRQKGNYQSVTEYHYIEKICYSSLKYCVAQFILKKK
jgi:hypothetical protein